MLVGGTLRYYQLGGLKFLMSLYNNNMNGKPTALGTGVGKRWRGANLYLMQPSSKLERLKLKRTNKPANFP